MDDGPENGSFVRAVRGLGSGLGRRGLPAGQKACRQI